MARSSLCMRLLVLACITLCVCVAHARRAKQIDYDALERAWEDGDAREELRSTSDEQFAKLADKSEDEAKALGPQMVFVALEPTRTRESLAALAARWKESLWNGGLDVSVYEIAAGEKLLVALQRGAQTADLRRFLLDQPEVRELESNGETFRPPSSTKTLKSKTLKSKSSKSKSSRTAQPQATKRDKHSERVDPPTADTRAFEREL